MKAALETELSLCSDSQATCYYDTNSINQAFNKKLEVSRRGTEFGHKRDKLQKACNSKSRKQTIRQDADTLNGAG